MRRSLVLYMLNTFDNNSYMIAFAPNSHVGKLKNGIFN